jgi:ATPase subunit of ABC transporter with duplicated ATPase domains
MANHSQPYLIAENLSYELAADQPLFAGIQLSISAADRIALVGANGVGKSTLLKILTGSLSPTQGVVHRHGAIYYLPQISTIRSIIETKSVLDYIGAITDEWWSIEHILDNTFGTSLDLLLPVQDLSGGELTKLLLAIGLAQSPDLLLLDEPTNHLDYLALEELAQFLCQFSGAFVIVSHKPFFLDRVVRITWELTPTGLQIYGGNFSFYREQQQLAHAARVRSHETARQEFQRAKAAAAQEQERAAQSQRYGRSQVGVSIERKQAAGMKRSAESTAGKRQVQNDRAIIAATQKMVETRVRWNKATSIQLAEKSTKHRQLLAVHDANLWIADRLLIQDIQLELASGDRLAIAGINGSGKSCLIQAILGRKSAPAFLQDGEVRCADMQTVYLDQNYELVDRQQTVLANLQRANPDLSYQLLRQQLGHFLFFNDDVYKSAAVLSGGELARLAIAMITITQLDLLILDEPTNNLDIVTINQMVEALNDYHGALWVISHDLDFLSRINITGACQIKNQTLQTMIYLPSDSSLYHAELLA